jgi:hypothetical protein
MNDDNNNGGAQSCQSTPYKILFIDRQAIYIEWSESFTPIRFLIYDDD